MPQDVTPKESLLVKVDMRKASVECKLPYLFANAVSTSRVGAETIVEFGSINQTEFAFAIQSKQEGVELPATIHSRILLSPIAVLNLHKQMSEMAEALVKENPALAQLIEIAR
jgi:hypothetical protein